MHLSLSSAFVARGADSSEPCVAVVLSIWCKSYAGYINRCLVLVDFWFPRLLLSTHLPSPSCDTTFNTASLEHLLCAWSLIMDVFIRRSPTTKVCMGETSVLQTAE